MVATSTLIALLILGVPIAFAVGLAAMGFLGASPFPLSVFAQRLFAGLDSFALLAIPLFVLAGELMNRSGITQRVIDTASAFVGHWRAGLAQINIWSSVLFAGLSGSAVADTAALGRVFIPTMEKQGYDRGFAAALTSASAVIGPIIPPSIPVIIYALIAPGTSVPALFLAGIVPGLLLAAMLSLFVFVSPKLRAIPRQSRASWRERGRAVTKGALPLLMPLFVIVAIVSGLTTPTEAAAFAALYALIVGAFIYRTLSAGVVWDVFCASMRDSSVILLIIGVVAAANWVLTINEIPQSLSAFVLSYVDSPLAFLLMVNVLLLLVGLVLEGIAAILVLVPILHPIAMSFGIDPTHFGIVVIFNLMIGLITPPMGLCLFVADSIAKVGIGTLTRRIAGLFLVELFVLLAITLVPALVTGLPQLFGY